MAPVLCLSPTLIDHTFPRSRDDLLSVASALGKISEFIEQGAVGLVLTGVFRDFFDDFCWNSGAPGSLLNQVYFHLLQWFTQPNEMISEVALSCVADYSPHPLPQNCHKQGLPEFWSEEAGRLLKVHDMCGGGSRFFIGVASESAFCGGDVGSYDNPLMVRAFPLVGPEQLGILLDAYEWEIPSAARRARVTISDVCRNFRVIGGTRIERPDGDSHYKVRFDGARSWTFSRNDDPVPRPYLAELVGITGLPVAVITTALTQGIIPSRTLRLRRFVTGPV